MKNTRANIPEYGRYKLDLVTQEIISKDGNIIQPRVSVNSKKGDIVVSLTDDNDKRQTVNYLKLVRKTVENRQIETEYDGILPKVVMAYYHLLTPEFKKMSMSEVSRLVRMDVPEAKLIVIGKMIQRMHTSEW